MNLVITGTDGMLGSAIMQMTDAACIGRGVDLTRPDAVAACFTPAPECVIHCAAHVGGVQRNASEPEAMYYSNAVMNAMVIHEAAVAGVKHVVAFGSNCAFASEVSETTIHDGEPYPNHRAYAYAKRMTDVHLEAARQQYGMTGTYLVPPSMYGPNDNFSLTDGHVVACLIRKAWEAKNHGGALEVWGDGEAVRDVAYSEDVARVALECLWTKPRRLVLGGEPLSVRDMATVIAEVVGVKEIRWLKDKPGGQIRRPMAKRYPFPTTFHRGVEKTVAWLAERWPNVRGT